MLLRDHQRLSFHHRIVSGKNRIRDVTRKTQTYKKPFIISYHHGGKPFSFGAEVQIYPSVLPVGNIIHSFQLEEN